MKQGAIRSGRSTRALQPPACHVALPAAAPRPEPLSGSGPCPARGLCSSCPGPTPPGAPRLRAQPGHAPEPAPALMTPRRTPRGALEPLQRHQESPSFPPQPRPSPPPDPARELVPHLSHRLRLHLPRPAAGKGPAGARDLRSGALPRQPQSQKRERYALRRLPALEIPAAGPGPLLSLPLPRRPR